MESGIVDTFNIDIMTFDTLLFSNVQFSSFYHVISVEESNESPQSRLSCSTSPSPHQRQCSSKFFDKFARFLGKTLF